MSHDSKCWLQCVRFQIKSTARMARNAAPESNLQKRPQLLRPCPVGYKQYNSLLVSNFKTPRAKSVTRKMGGPPRSETFSTIKNR